jgi:hypothetical protein
MRYRPKIKYIHDWLSLFLLPAICLYMIKKDNRSTPQSMIEVNYVHL